MTRRKRSDAPGSWHHVMNRGVGQRSLFESARDIRYFLSRLALSVRRGEIEVHAWCALTTHFHLLVRSPLGRMDEALRRTQQEYSRWFNRLRERDGPLYRSRFTSRCVDTLNYRRIVVRYIDTNAVHAGLCREGRRYPHGSASAYERARGPAWLSRDWIEGEVRRVAGSASYRSEDYAAAFPPLLADETRALVERRLESSATGPDPIEDLLAAAPAAWLEWLWRKTEVADGTHPGLPLATPRSVLSTLRRIDPGRDARVGAEVDAIEIALLRELGAATYREIGSLLSISPAAACGARARHVRRFCEDPRYASTVAELARRTLAAIHGRRVDE